MDIPGKVTFRESEVLSPGDGFASFDVAGIKVGTGICYDLRFPEIGQIYSKLGCKLLLYPGGLAHWKLLLQAMSIDNQLYVACVSPARDEKASYVAWDHSMITDPWGEEVANAEAEENTILADLHFGKIDEVRKNIPTSMQKRYDLYKSAEQA